MSGEGDIISVSEEKYLLDRGLMLGLGFLLTAFIRFFLLALLFGFFYKMEVSTEVPNSYNGVPCCRRLISSSSTR